MGLQVVTNARDKLALLTGHRAETKRTQGGPGFNQKKAKKLISKVKRQNKEPKRKRLSKKRPTWLKASKQRAPTQEPELKSLVMFK